MNSPASLARLRWRARRGLLENDLILKRFLDHYGPSLSDNEISALTSLLELSDNDLLALLLGHPELEMDIELSQLKGDKLTVKVLKLLRSV